MLSRLQRFIKKPAFKTMLREVIQRELREMRKQTPTAQQAVITELNQTLATMR